MDVSMEATVTVSSQPFLPSRIQYEPYCLKTKTVMFCSALQCTCSGGEMVRKDFWFFSSFKGVIKKKKKNKKTIVKKCIFKGFQQPNIIVLKFFSTFLHILDHFLWWTISPLNPNFTPSLRWDEHDHIRTVLSLKYTHFNAMSESGIRACSKDGLQAN